MQGGEPLIRDERCVIASSRLSLVRKLSLRELPPLNSKTNPFGRENGSVMGLKDLMDDDG